jgi:hypothetical protein
MFEAFLSTLFSLSNECENGLTAEKHPFFYDLHRFVSNWHNEIFTYFDISLTLQTCTTDMISRSLQRKSNQVYYMKLPRVNIYLIRCINLMKYLKLKLSITMSQSISWRICWSLENSNMTFKLHWVKYRI